MPSKRDGGAIRRFSPGAALVGALGAAVLTYNFGSRLLITNDDTRFPVLARDALANGHWLIPAMPDGRPHIVKPPLAAWLIALVSWSEGRVSVRAAVLPSVLAAIGVVLLTYSLGRRLFGASAGVAAGLTVATMVGMYTMAHSPMPDMLQLLAGTAAIAVYVAAGFGASPTMLVLFCGVVGLGSLAKGVPGFVALAVAVLDAFIAERLAGLKRLVSAGLGPPRRDRRPVVDRRRCIRGLWAIRQRVRSRRSGALFRSQWAARLVGVPRAARFRRHRPAAVGCASPSGGMASGAGERSG